MMVTPPRWMATCGVIGLLIAGVSPADDSSRASTGSPRKVMEIKQDLVQTMRNEALAEDAESRLDSIRRMVALLNEVTDHPDTLSGPFRRMALRARIRLRRIQDELQHESVDVKRPETLAQQVNPGQANPAVGGVPADQGVELIELIEQTIAQDVWVGQGGSASMVYYAPVHGLVVTAPSFVHDQIADLLWQLRAAGP